MNDDNSILAAHELAEALRQIAVAVEPMLAYVADYRLRCERDGYLPVVAQQMAADYHAALLRMINR